jgi:hypothetical protein
LEEYVLGRLPENELETIETHALACEFCLDRLEDLDLHAATMKLALRDLQVEESSRASDWRTALVGLRFHNFPGLPLQHW